MKKVGNQVYQLPVFSKKFCHELVEEIKHFQAQNIPFERPNSMNKYGLILDELLDFQKFFDQFRSQYLQPLARSLFS